MFCRGLGAAIFVSTFCSPALAQVYQNQPNNYVMYHPGYVNPSFQQRS